MADTRSSLELISYTVIEAITTVLSIVGNSLVCLAFIRNTRLRTVTNFFILSLAVADLLVATFVFPFFTVATGLCAWPFDYSFCQFTGFFVYYWAQVSLCTLALTSINRYFCVVKPHCYRTFFTKKKTVLFIISVWVFLLTFYLTFTLTLPVINRWHHNSFHCRAIFIDEHTERAIYVFYGCFFIVAMLLIVFGYGSVYCAIRQHRVSIAPSRQEQNGPMIRHAHEIKSCRLLFAAVLGFFSCWTPLSMSFLLGFGFKMSIPSIAESIFTILSTFSAWINPIIYGVLNRAMRKEFAIILVCRKVG